MTRYQFGGTAADLGVVGSAGNSLLTTPSTYLRFWTTRTAGTEYTDFLDETGVAIAAGAWRTETTGEFPLFSGPDTVTYMWCGNSTDTSKRIKVFAHADQVIAALPAAGSSLAPTAEKTTSYTPVNGDMVPIDLTAGNFAVTLPNAPVDKFYVHLQVVAVSAGVLGAYTATISRSGTDTFDRTTGSTSTTLATLGHGITLQYKASTKVWYQVASHISTANLQTLYDLRYSAISLTDKYLAWPNGDTVTAGMPVFTQDLYFPQTTPISDVKISQEIPNLASGTVVYTFIDRNPTTFAQVTIGTITIQAAGSTATSTANTRAATMGLGSAYSMAAGHVMRCYVSAANGASYWGAAPQIELLQSGTWTLPSVPSVPGTITATPATSSVTLACTLPTGAEELLYVDTSSTPPRVVGRTGTGTIVDTNLVAASSHTYVAYGLGTWTASAASSSVTSGPSSSSYAQFDAVAGGINSAKWTQTNGTNAGTGVTVASGYATMTSGAVGSGATADRVYLDYIELGSGTGAVWSAAKLYDIEYAQFQGANQFLVYISRNAFTSLATSFTTGIQFQINASGIRVGIKTGGSFIILTASGSSQATHTSTDASGVVPWTAAGGAAQTADSTHFYGARLEALPIAGDGTQVINVYTGTTTQAAGDTLNLLTAVTLTAVQRSAIPAGHIGIEQDGANSTGATQTTQLKCQIQTLSPMGT